MFVLQALVNATSDLLQKVELNKRGESSSGIDRFE